MPKRKLFFMLIFVFMIAGVADAQVMMRRGPGRFRSKPANAARNLAPFKPSLILSIGYGFPNLDKIYLPEYYDAYRGSASQSGPLTGSIDYRFSRRMSIGATVTHGSLNAVYYDYYSSLPAFTAKFDNWSFMLNLVRYIPVSQKITPYIRTSIGINSWKQNYTDAYGNKMEMMPADLPDLAYQAGIGAKFNLSQHAGLFAEAGYGKYILQAGLSLKF